MKNYIVIIGYLFFSSITSSFGAVIIDFDSVQQGATVDSFYNGGTDSAGNAGQNLGVDFTPGDWITISGYGQTSQPNFSYSASGAGQVNIAGGFTDVFSFTYGAFVDSIVTLFDGLNGTGLSLATLILPTNNPNSFSPASISFAGVARSITIQSGANQFGWDDMTMGLQNSVPEPTTIALMGLGFAGMGYMRRRKAQA